MSTANGEPTVTSKPPPAALLSFVNPVVRVVLRSPFGGRMGALAVLRFTGRLSGRRYEIPVGVHEVNDIPTVFTDRPWRINFRGGADVSVIRGRKEQRGRAELVEDPDVVGPALAAAAKRAGARNLGLSVKKGAEPTVADFASVGRSMIKIQLHE